MKTTDEILELLRQFKSVAGEKYGIDNLLFSAPPHGANSEKIAILTSGEVAQNHLPHLYGYQGGT